MSWRWSKRLVAILATTVLAIGVGWAKDKDKDESDIAKRIGESAKVLNEIMGTPDKAIPDKVMREAKCIAIVPSMVKIALGVGGEHGKGLVMCRTENGWSAPAPISVTGGSWGLQIGGQAVDLIMIVTNDQGMQHLLADKFKIGADASATAGPVGRNAGADTDWKLKAEVLSYSRSRGVFAGIDLNGSKVSQDMDETRVLFGKSEPFEEILDGKVKAPAESQPLMQAVRRYSGQAEANASDR